MSLALQTQRQVDLSEFRTAKAMEPYLEKPQRKEKKFLLVLVSILVLRQGPAIYLKLTLHHPV